MKYVLDSSVALKWVLPEPDSGRAIRLRNDYNASIHDLMAPDLFIPEIANALADDVVKENGSLAALDPALSFGKKATPFNRRSSISLLTFS